MSIRRNVRLRRHGLAARHRRNRAQDRINRRRSRSNSRETVMLPTLVGKLLLPSLDSERLHLVSSLDRTRIPNRTFNKDRTHDRRQTKVRLELRCLTIIWDLPEVLSMGHCLNGHRARVQSTALLIQETGL